MGKGKKFIDKKNDVVYSFRVGARSQRDPLAADETAPQGVLIDNNPNENNKGQVNNYGLYFDDKYDYLKHLRSTREGINWDDEHLEVYEIRAADPQANKKELRNKRLKLPSSAFESYVEEPIGLLNRAAPVTGPCPELDPDVVAHLDDDFPSEQDVHGVENILRMFEEDAGGEWEDMEDDEIWGIKEIASKQYHNDQDMPPLEEGVPGIHYMPEMLIKQGKDETDSEEEEEDRWSTADAGKDFNSDFNVSEDEGDDEARDHLGSLGGKHHHHHKDGDDDGDDTKSHFTEYSLSSSVIHRNKNLSNLDEQFQALFLREYNEEQIGPLDGEEIDGYIDENNELYKQAKEQTMKQISKLSLDDEREWIVHWIQDQDSKIANGQIPHHDEENEIEIEDKEPEQKWDCQSVLSTYSNLYNHPKVLDKPSRKITINPITGLPMEPLKKGLTKKALALHNGDESDLNIPLDRQTMSIISTISIRPPGETPEERNERKHALKDLRRERRIQKKNTKLAFKDEKKQMDKLILKKARGNTVKVV